MSSTFHSSPLTAKRLYLASQSPRRLELLRQVGLEPTVLPLRNSPGRIDVDESPLPDELATDYVLRLAHMKARAGADAQQARRLPAWPILAADTTVTIDGHILGKPTDTADAAAMLRRYSGRSHTVLTAVAASSPLMHWRFLVGRCVCTRMAVAFPMVLRSRPPVLSFILRRRGSLRCRCDQTAAIP